MRPLALLLLALSLTAAELEQITLTDGRRLIGYYDEAAGKLTVEGPPKVVLSVSASQVASRAAYLRAPETDPAKRDAAELVRLEAEREAALADVTRLRKFASTRTGKDAEIALSQADERKAQAENATKKIDALREKIAASKAVKEQPAPAIEQQPVAVEPQAAPKVPVDIADLRRSVEEALILRDQAVLVEFNAYVAWLSGQDLSDRALPPLSADPRQSEIEAVRRVEEENKRRGNRRRALEKAGECRSLEEKEQVLAWFRGLARNEVPDLSPERQKELDAANEEAAIQSGYKKKTTKAK